MPGLISPPSLGEAILSNSKNDDAGLYAALVILLFGAIAAGIWKFGQTFGLDFSTSVSVLGRLVVVGLLVAASMYFGADAYGAGQYIGFSKVWPLLLAALWWCCWPALDYRASQFLPSFLPEATVWWDEWYTKWGVLVGIVGVGYALKHWLDD